MVVLALDFDGVISDSAGEAFFVATQTYLDLCPGSLLLRDAPQNWTPTAVENFPLYRSFIDLMALGNRAEDFGVALAILEKGAAVESQQAYDEFRGAQPPEFLEDFHRRFYEVRSDWSFRDPDGWRSWMKPYDSFLEILQRRSSEVCLAIATAKDRDSIRSLLSSYGVASLFSDSLVFDKEAGVNKRAHLELIRDRLGCAFEEVLFIDDKVKHLHDVSRLGVRCGLATWGYNGPPQVEEARRFGHRVLGLDDVERQVFGGRG